MMYGCKKVVSNQTHLSMYLRQKCSNSSILVARQRSDLNRIEKEEPIRACIDHRRHLACLFSTYTSIIFVLDINQILIMSRSPHNNAVYRPASPPAAIKMARPAFNWANFPNRRLTSSSSSFVVGFAVFSAGMLRSVN